MISGRIQSRQYTKKLSEEESEVRVAYELSISKIVADERAELRDEATVGDSDASEVSATADDDRPDGL